jgi:hypothetical protein
MDAIGPETFTFTELVKIIRSRVGSRARIISVPPVAALALSGLLGRLVHDVVLTRDELLGLTQNLLVTDSTPTGRTPFSEWARDNAHLLGAKYASELERHYRSPLHSQA